MTPLADCFYDLDQLMRRVDEYPNLARADYSSGSSFAWGCCCCCAAPKWLGKLCQSVSGSGGEACATTR
jgi:hypothetical protein